MKLTLETEHTSITIEENLITLADALDLVARALVAIGYSYEGVREVIGEI